MYQPNNYLRKAIEEGNVDRVRGALVGIIQSDPGFETNELEQALAYVKNNGIDPFIAENDPQFPMTNDFAESATYLRSNFTKMRLEHIRKVGRATHPPQRPISGPSYYSSAPATNRPPVQEDKPPKKAWGRRILLVLLRILLELLLVLVALRLTHLLPAGWVRWGLQVLVILVAALRVIFWIRQGAGQP